MDRLELLSTLTRAAIRGALWSAAVNGTLFVGGQALALAPFGNRFLLEVGILAIFGILPVAAAVPLSALGLLIPTYRPKAAHILPFSLGYVVVFFGCVVLTHQVRTLAFTALARRSVPLIKAIQAFERKHTTPPESLEALVPEFLPAIPKTGMGAYPEYSYSAQAETLSPYPPGNSWAVYVHTPSGGINFDQFFYVPQRNYPERIGGDPIQRIGDWAYLHE